MNDRDRKLWELEVREQIRGDGVDFWSSRSGWPISAPGKIFLLEAIEAEGRAMFGARWAGTEQQEQFLPLLLEDANVAAGGLDELYALHLIGTYRPEMGRPPVGETGDYIYRHPLSDEEWGAAFSIFNEAIFPQRLAGLRRLRAVTNSILGRLVKGELNAWSRSLRGVGHFRAIDQESWTIDIVMARFLFGIFDPHNPLQDATLKEAPHRVKASGLPEELWPEFIFLDADQVSKPSSLPATQVDAELVKPKTRQDIESAEAEAEKIYYSMSENGRVRRRDFESRCQLEGIRSTISRNVFKRLNSARPGQRN